MSLREILRVVLQVFCCLHDDDSTFRELIKGEAKFSIWENTLSYLLFAIYMDVAVRETFDCLFFIHRHVPQPFNKPNIIILLNASWVFRWFHRASSIHELRGEVNWTEFYGRKVNIIGFVSTVKLMRLYFSEWVSRRRVGIPSREKKSKILTFLKRPLCWW